MIPVESPQEIEQAQRAASEEFAQRMLAHEARRNAVREPGIAALKRLLPIARRDTGQSRVVGRFLLSLYNGRAFPFDLTDLRVVDDEIHDDCLAVLRLDASPEKEVHHYFVNGDRIWDELKLQWTTERDLRAWGQPS